MATYQLHLNFLPVSGEIPQFTIYRKLRAPGEDADPNGGIFGYDLPESLDDLAARQQYLVSLKPAHEFSPFAISANAKIDLTRRALLNGLTEKCVAVLTPDEFCLPTDGFIKEVAFLLETHKEGEERVVLQPYFLGATRQFGFLVDFHFHLREGEPFTRRVQQLSLSLDKNYRRNLDCYTDRLAKIRTWIQRFHAQLFPIRLHGAESDMSVATDFVPLPARQLRSKIYVVAGNREYRSQFVGVKEAGPLEGIPECPPLLFVFREQDREAARRLARALKGNEPRVEFLGFDRLFRAHMSISSDPVVVRDFTRGEMERALECVTRTEGIKPIPVIVMPKDENDYATHKAVFAHSGIATQVCTLETINDDYDLKWSVANIALQVFCKAGGTPWKVKPLDDRSLIIGISQSHKLFSENGTSRIEKYFAFSVLTDSSGIFQSLEVIGQGEGQGEYLAQLRTNLRRLLSEQAARFERVVLHTSFKLRRAEMNVIEEVVKEAVAGTSKCRFAVVKVNQKNRFFGVNRAVNSLVPYEGSSLKLGAKEYLLWFEGVFADNPNVKKAFPGPTHIEFLKVSETPLIGDEQVLQDLVNLSGANWRGFNAKSSPVSIFYCRIVAELIGDFQERNLPLPEIGDFRPWFL